MSNLTQKQKKYNAVMLIDDNEIDNLINQKMIEAIGVCEHIYTHTAAKAAIEFLKNIEKINLKGTSLLPDVVFLDIDIPLMDGFQFLDEFDKLSENIKSHCQVVMLTSSINPHDLAQSKKNKYVKKYISKPLTQEVLINLSF